MEEIHASHPARQHLLAGAVTPVGVARCIGMQNSRFFSPLGLSLGRVGGIGVRYTPPRLDEDGASPSSFESAVKKIAFLAFGGC